MGQYGNQPDFGTIARQAPPIGEPGGTSSPFLNSAALYIATGGDLICKVVGGNLQSPDGGEVGYTMFKNIPNGTFFPVIVDYIYETDGGDGVTTCENIIALY